MRIAWVKLGAGTYFVEHNGRQVAWIGRDPKATPPDKWAWRVSFMDKGGYSSTLTAAKKIVAEELRKATWDK